MLKVIECVECAEWNRTGNCICPICNKEYIDHPYCSKSELPESLRSTWLYKEYYIHVLCNGDHVKL